MPEKRTQKASTEEIPEPEPQSDPWADNQAQIAARTAEAVKAAKRSDSDVRLANAHLDPAEVD